MGLFDFLKGGSSSNDGKKKPPAAAKFADAAGSKRAQPYDRQEAIQELGKLGTPEAVEALLKRFTFATDPSITDQEEKEAAYEGILKAGKEGLEPIRVFAGKAESLSWPLRILKAIFDEEELVDELLTWLGKWDTEYAKFIDPKLQLLEELAEHKNAKIREAVEPFLQDVNDPARFNAVAATLTQKDTASVGPLLDLLVDEESTRIRTKIADGFAALAWEVPEDRRDAVRKVLPNNFSINATGTVIKRT